MSFLDRARKAKRATGKKILTQFLEIASLRSRDNEIGVSDYYDLLLYDDVSFERSSLDEYLGWKKSSEIDSLMNESHWRATANDKILCAQLLHLAGVRTPETIAIYSKLKRPLQKANVISEKREFIQFLRSCNEYPLFIKPNAGTYGRSSYALTSYDSVQNVWHTASGGSLSEDEISNTIDFLPYRGMLVQKRITQHPVVRHAVGETVSCVRLMVLLNQGNPRPFFAFWKISTGKNMTDNFSRGATGNILASINLEQGTIERVITGLGENYQEIEFHPDTKSRILGMQLPDWQEALDQCLKGAHYFEGLGFQHWDIAFSEDGPVVLEVNTEPDLSIPQLAARRGLLNGEMKKAIADMQQYKKNIKDHIRRRRELGM